MSSMSFSLPKAALDQLKGFITLCKSKPEVLHNEELSFFSDYLLSMGASLPPKPEQKQKEAQKEEPKESAKVEEPDVEMEVESEESDVELDMDGVIGEYILVLVTSLTSNPSMQATLILMNLMKWEILTRRK